MMRGYLIRIPAFLRLFSSHLTWTTGQNNSVAITIDDGPNPSSTPLLLRSLDDTGLKATFFCLGTQAAKYSGLLDEIRAAGHVIGSHGYDHLDGWKTDTSTYIENAQRAADLIGTNLYRPPYGRITPGQLNRIKSLYTIVMWTVMPGDFEPKLSTTEVNKRISDHLQDQDIMVLHDQMASKRHFPSVINTIIEVIEKHQLRAVTLHEVEPQKPLVDEQARLI
ncbi:MAG: polysaccharide deacetylase family protein [Bacteroidota bacterium]